jgi:hypothetical protein
VPLFNPTHSLHPSLLSAKFEEYFQQGSVGKRNFDFDNPEKPHLKFFVVVNSDVTEEETLVVLSHTSPDYKLNNPLLKRDLIKVTPDTTDNIFHSDCYIDCSAIHCIKRTIIFSEYLGKRAILIGALPKSLRQEIITTIMYSKVVEQEYQERIS